jgi:hypothetical protein
MIQNELNLAALLLLVKSSLCQQIVLHVIDTKFLDACEKEGAFGGSWNTQLKGRGYQLVRDIEAIDQEVIDGLAEDTGDAWNHGGLIDKILNQLKIDSPDSVSRVWDFMYTPSIKSTPDVVFGMLMDEGTRVYLYSLDEEKLLVLHLMIDREHAISKLYLKGCDEFRKRQEEILGSPD